MEDFYTNNNSLHKGYNNNIEYDYENNTITGIRNEWKNVVSCIIVTIGLPLTLVAIYGLYSQVRDGQVAPIYIINLLISDLIQFCTMIVYVTPDNFIVDKIFKVLYFHSVIVSVCFMVCVALERYLVIAWPLWYRFRRTIKTSVVVCVMVWILTLILFLLLLLLIFINYAFIHLYTFIFGLFFFLPLPLFIFFLCGTIKALSAAVSVPPDEKRRILAILVLVLLIYTLLFMPTIIWFFVEEARNHDTFENVADILPLLSPLADLFLYFFSRKGAADRFLACVCRCRMNSDNDNISMNDINL